MHVKYSQSGGIPLNMEPSCYSFVGSFMELCLPICGADLPNSHLAELLEPSVEHVRTYVECTAF